MTILAQLFLNESTELDFGVEISGAENDSFDARFIIEGPEFGIICKCMETDGVITASVPKLQAILQPGTYSTRLEVIIDGKHFQPLTEDIKFNQPVSVVASSIRQHQENTVKVHTGKINIRMSEDKVTATPLNREAVKKSSFSGYVDKSVVFGEGIDTTHLENAERLSKLKEMADKIQVYEDKLNKIKKR